MPLLDHFHGPLAQNRHWESFHAVWAAAIVRHLNRHILPERCVAEAHVHLGGRVEVDVATFDTTAPTGNVSNNGGVATAVWAPPATALSMPAVFPDEFEVQILDTRGGPTLVGAIELVSPANKDRPETRLAFATRCASNLQQGIGLVVVDIVSERLANLHNELIDLLRQPATLRLPDEASLYAVAYRPARRATGDQIDVWLHPLALGQVLPTVALALRGIGTFPLDLETSYATTCLDCRL